MTVELVNYKRNGEKFWNLLSMTPVYDSAGSLMSFIGVQSDISELIRRKEAEKELQEAKVGSHTALYADSYSEISAWSKVSCPFNTVKHHLTPNDINIALTHMMCSYTHLAQRVLLLEKDGNIPGTDVTP